MGKANRRKLVYDVTKRLVDDGKLIEAGWMALRLMVVGEDAPQIQLDEMRGAFFAGAQHLWGSIMSFLDEDHEPTDADLRRMDAIERELQGFIEEFSAKHGLRPSGRQ